MKQFLKFLSGNKTIICSTVFGFISQFGVDIGLSEKLVAMILYVATALGIASFGHHVQKGKLTTGKN